MDGNEWNERFAYMLDFDDEGKVTDYQVWADSGAAYLASKGQLDQSRKVSIYEVLVAFPVLTAMPRRNLRQRKDKHKLVNRPIGLCVSCIIVYVILGWSLRRSCCSSKRIKTTILWKLGSAVVHSLHLRAASLLRNR